MKNSNSRIKQLRKEQNLTQKELAERLNTTYDTISLWELSKRSPSAEDLIVLSRIFKCSIDYILGVEDEDGIITMPGELAKDEQELLDNYHSLNVAGQAKVRGYIEGLKSAPEFVQTNRPIKL